MEIDDCADIMPFVHWGQRMLRSGRGYGPEGPEELLTCLYENGILMWKLEAARTGLEKYCIDLMRGKEVPI